MSLEDSVLGAAKRAGNGEAPRRSLLPAVGHRTARRGNGEFWVSGFFYHWEFFGGLKKVDL